VYPLVCLRPGTPFRVFKNIEFRGVVAKRKLGTKSAFVRDLSVPFTGKPEYCSQLGGGYSLAELGSLDELLDRLQKYDKVDLPLQRDRALMAIRHFTDKIGHCEFLTPLIAYGEMEANSSPGYGARENGVNSRKDPKMLEYLAGYYHASLKQPHHVIISASQKDEMRAWENGKVKTPRLFTAYPPEHTFLATIVLGDFLRQFYEHRFCVDGSVSAVGDPMQKGAMAVYEKELDKRPFLYCTDTSGQDASVSREFIEMVYAEIRTKFVLDEDDSSLFDAVRFNSVHKMMSVAGQFYLVSRGLGSGDYLTVVINIMWRLYMILDNYHHRVENYFEDNTTVINGDDLIMSSEFGDLDLNSRHATITWAGRPVTWAEMDFCSTRFRPYIHQDAQKVRAVVYGRRRAAHQLHPDLEMQRLGGLLRVLSNREVYDEILGKMEVLRDKHNLFQEFDDLWISFEELWENYNCCREYL